MDKSENIPLLIKRQLDSVIAESTDFHRHLYANHPSNFSRKRVLDFDTMMKLLISMQGGSIKKELYDAHIDVSTAAFVKRRDSLSHWDFEQVLDGFNALHENPQTFKGYRLFAVDGTTVNMARNPDSESYVQYDSNIKGYNQLHANILYDILNNTYIHCVLQPQPRQDEIGALRFMLEWLEFPQKTLIIADRGYESYNTFAHFLENPDVDFLIRVKQNKSAMREVKKMPMMELDKDISFTITTTQTNVDKENGYILLQKHKDSDRKYSMKTRNTRWDFDSPYFMKFRVVRFKLPTGEYETLATSLPRDQFSVEEIKELYHERWRIETAFRHLKYDLGLTNLHGKKDEFVKQEVIAALIMANFCSRIINGILVEQKEENIYEYKVNLKMAIYLCKKFYRNDSGDGEQLMKDIEKYLEPVRPGRSDERNIRAKSFAGFIYRVPA